MQRGKEVQTQSAFEHHEAHLSHRGPCQAYFDADARHHHPSSQHGRADPEEDQYSPRWCGLFQQRREADQDETAQIDHTGMQQGRNGRRRFHDLNQPPMNR